MSSPAEFPTNPPISPFTERKNADDLDKAVENYCSKEKSFLIEFIKSKDIPIVDNIRQEDYEKAESLGAGVSGAKKILLEGKLYVIKPQNFTEIFQKNFSTALSRRDFSHKLVSESDDSFAHFPRKEVLGYHIAKSFSINHLPNTKLITIDSHTIASLQDYIPVNVAESLLRQSRLDPTDIQFNSVIKTLLFYFVTENIDGHGGNVLLYNSPLTEEEDDDLQPIFEVIPIDYGLILPRHSSIYPDELNLIKKGLFNLYKHKSFNPLKLVKELNLKETLISDNPDVRELSTLEEQRILTTNLQSLIAVAQACGENKIQIEEFFQKFVETVVKTTTNR